MKRTLFGHLVFTVVTTALAVMCASCKPPAPVQLPPPVVEIMEVATTNVPRHVVFIGQLDSPQSVEVRARVEAFVEKILFTEGTEVKEGDPLFLLDRKPFEERLAAAKGTLAEAQAALKKYQADVARLSPLAKLEAIPRQDLEHAIASVSIGEANVLSAEARVKSAELDLGYCDVRAPVSGLIGAAEVPVGSLVGKGQPTLLATLSQLHPIWFYCSIGEVDYLRAQRAALEHGGQLAELPLTLILPDGTELREPGKWVFLDRAVDISTGTLRARAEFPNVERLLRPGMFARIRVSFKTDKGSILIPERALVELQGKSFAWVIGTDNLARQRKVEVAPTKIGECVVILDGLHVGDRIVVEGLQKVYDGAVVRPMTAAQLAEAAAALAGKPAGAGHAQAGEAKPVKE